jgi:hypothetical protein
MRSSNKVFRQHQYKIGEYTMKIVKTLVVALLTVPASIGISVSMAVPAFSQQVNSEEKVKEIQIALREFGFYKGKLDGKISKSLYAAMTKYTSYVRSKGWSAATGELTDEEVVFLLKQYEKRVAAKLSSEGSNSSENSAGDSSSDNAASEPTNSGQSAGTSGGASATSDGSGSSEGASSGSGSASSGGVSVSSGSGSSGAGAAD